MKTKKYGERYVNLSLVTHWSFKAFDEGTSGTSVFFVGGGRVFIEGDFTEEIEKDMQLL